MPSRCIKPGKVSEHCKTAHWEMHQALLIMSPSGQTGSSVGRKCVIWAFIPAAWAGCSPYSWYRPHVLGLHQGIKSWKSLDSQNPHPLLKVHGRKQLYRCCEFGPRTHSGQGCPSHESVERCFPWVFYQPSVFNLSFPFMSIVSLSGKVKSRCIGTWIAIQVDRQWVRYNYMWCSLGAKGIRSHFFHFGNWFHPKDSLINWGTLLQQETLSMPVATWTYTVKGHSSLYLGNCLLKPSEVFLL